MVFNIFSMIGKRDCSGSYIYHHLHEVDNDILLEPWRSPCAFSLLNEFQQIRYDKLDCLRDLRYSLLALQ